MVERSVALSVVEVSKPHISASTSLSLRIFLWWLSGVETTYFGFDFAQPTDLGLLYHVRFISYHFSASVHSFPSGTLATSE